MICKEVQLVKTRRLSKFWGQLFMVICIFAPLDLTVLILEWSPPAQVYRQQICPWLLKLMTSQVVQGTWIHMGGSVLSNWKNLLVLYLSIFRQQFFILRKRGRIRSLTDGKKLLKNPRWLIRAQLFESQLALTQD